MKCKILYLWSYHKGIPESELKGKGSDVNKFGDTYNGLGVYTDGVQSTNVDDRHSGVFLSPVFFFIFGKTPRNKNLKLVTTLTMSE